MTFLHISITWEVSYSPSFPRWLLQIICLVLFYIHLLFIGNYGRLTMKRDFALVLCRASFLRLPVLFEISSRSDISLYVVFFLVLKFFRVIPVQENQLCVINIAHTRFHTNC